MNIHREILENTTNVDGIHVNTLLVPYWVLVAWERENHYWVIESSMNLSDIEEKKVEAVRESDINGVI